MEQNNQYTNNPYIGGKNEQLYPTLPTQQEPTENVPVYGQYTPKNQFQTEFNEGYQNQPKFNEGYGQYNQKGGNEYSGSFEQSQQQYNQGYGNQQQFNQGW